MARTTSGPRVSHRHNLPIKLLKVAFYLDDDGRRFLSVEWGASRKLAPR